MADHDLGRSNPVWAAGQKIRAAPLGEKTPCRLPMHICTASVNSSAHCSCQCTDVVQVSARPTKAVWSPYYPIEQIAYSPETQTLAPKFKDQDN